MLSHTPICPYCLVREADSREHIFPQFLGGRETILACSTCNNDLFGTKTEGVVARQMAQLIVRLAQCGLTPKGKHVWKKAFSKVVGDTEIWYDLQSDGSCVRSSSSVERGPDGTITALYLRGGGNDSKQLKSLEKAHPGVRFGAFEETEMVAPPGKLELQLPLSKELQRLSMKICVALGVHFGVEAKNISHKSRKFLLDAEPLRPPVHVNFPGIESLESLKNGFCHSVYVEGNPLTGLHSGVVEFFGFTQMYVQLSRHYVGPMFAAIGEVNLVTRAEALRMCDPISVVRPVSRRGKREYMETLERGWLKLESHMQRNLGKSLNMSSDSVRIIE